MLVRVLFGIAAAAVLLPGCGGSADDTPSDPIKAVSASVRDQVRDAQDVDPAAFPKPSGSSLEDFAGQFETGGAQAVAASSVYTPKRARLAFGLLDDKLHF